MSKTTYEPEGCKVIYIVHENVDKTAKAISEAITKGYELLSVANGGSSLHYVFVKATKAKK